MNTWRFFKKLATPINKLPFAGKIFLRPVILYVYEETHPTNKTTFFVLGMAFLFAVIFAHSKLAIQSLCNVETTTKYKLAIVWLYIALNFAIVYAQIILLLRVCSYFFNWMRSKKVRQCIKESPQMRYHKWWQILWYCSFTLAAHQLFYWAVS